MPTSTVTELDDAITMMWGVVVPAVYNGRLYLINAWGERVVIVDVDDKQLIDSGQLDTNLRGENKFLGVHYNPPVVKIKHAYARSGELVIAVDRVDLSTKQVTRTELRTVSLSWLTRWEDIAHGTSIPPSLVLLVDWDNGDVHYVNAETGSVVDIDLGSAGYTNEFRFSHKWIAKENDIEMLAGKHLSGSSHEKWSVYSKTRTDLGFATGGGSPRPCIGGMAIFTDEILMLASSGGVVGQDNDFAVLDHNFAQLATIDLSAILGFSAALPHGHIIAKKSGGGYYAILGADDNVNGYATKFAAYWVELDSSFGVQSSTKLAEVSTINETLSNLYPTYSDITSSPVLHLQRKKIYFYTRDPEANKGWLVEVDISDVWGQIEEFNQRMWIVGLGRVPTIMTLTVTPL